jgi:hypothetical protein
LPDEFSAIVSLSPSDLHGTRGPPHPVDVPHLLVLASLDGDVWDHVGLTAYELMKQRMVGTRPAPKAVVHVEGANHNFTNTMWNASDARPRNALERQERALFRDADAESKAQRTVFGALVSTFFAGHMGPESTSDLRNAFDPAYALPPALESLTRLQRTYLPGVDGRAARTVRRFHDGEIYNVRTGNGASAAFAPNEPWRWAVGTTPAMNVSWQKKRGQPAPFVEFGLWGPARDAGPGSTLDIDLARTYDEAAAFRGTPTDFGIELLSVTGERAPHAFRLRDQTELYGPYRVGVMATARLPIAACGFAAGTAIAGVRLTFDDEVYGRLTVGDVRYCP